MATSSSMPVVLAFSLSELRLGEMNAHVFEHLKRRSNVEIVTSRDVALQRLSKGPRPHAILLTDGYVIEPGQEQLLAKVESYTRQGGIVVFGCQFSSFVSRDELEAMFQHTFGLPWTRNNYYRSTFAPNRGVKGIDLSALPSAYSMKAVTLGKVTSSAAVFVETADYGDESPVPAPVPTGNVDEAPVAFTKVGRGYLGYVGDVNNEEPTSHVIAAMIFASLPQSRAGPSNVQADPKATTEQPAASASVPEHSGPTQTAKPKVLMISLELQGTVQFENMGQQIFSALNKHTQLVQATTSQSAVTHLSTEPKPVAVLLTHPDVTQYEVVIDRLKEYVNGGGRMIVGFSEFLNHLPLPQFEPFFRFWNLHWAAGAYHRTTSALNPAGIPSPLRPNALFAAYSMKAVHLKHVKAKHRVYVPLAPSCIEDQASQPGEAITGALLQECPAAWAPVGRGFVGFVGDVNAEEESTRLVLEMCGLAVAAGDLGPRRCAVGVTLGSGGSMEVITETYAERQLVVRAKKDYPSRRPREDEVAARAVKRANASRRKRIVAEGLKEEGNKFFKQGKFAEAASRYRQAVLVYGPRPVYLTNLAAALLKMGRFSSARDAAYRALTYEPTNLKALYRSGMAFKEQEMYDRAIEDFKRILILDPSNATAQAALSETIQLNDGDVSGEPELVEDNSSEGLWETATESDSSEYDHNGNGTPCRYLNHDGCRHGSHCRWKHAPDDRSVRDELGRNVCIAWLLGKCLFENRCYYAHDRTYLPHGGWWNDRKKVRALSDELGVNVSRANKRIDQEIFFASLWLINDWRSDQWASGRFSALDDEPVPSGRVGDSGSIIVNTTQRNGRFQHEYSSNTGTARTRAGPAGSRYGDEWEDDEEDDYEERANNFGFSDDEVNELLCQGVKPWDDDAWDVLDALRGM